MLSIVQVAIPCPLRQSFDYLSDQPVSFWNKGSRVKVPFGSRQLIGIVLGVIEIEKDRDISKLKSVLECIDQQSFQKNAYLALPSRRHEAQRPSGSQKY